MSLCADTAGPRSPQRGRWLRRCPGLTIGPPPTLWEDAGLVVSEMGDPWVLAAAETDAGLRRLEGLGFELEL